MGKYLSMKKSTALVVLGTLGGSAFLTGCRSNTSDQDSRYDNSTSGGRGGAGGYYGGGRGYSSPRGGFGSTGGSSGRSGGFFSGG